MGKAAERGFDFFVSGEFAAFGLRQTLQYIG